MTRYLSIAEVLELHRLTFVDGNKRTGHAAMEAMLMLNGLELKASVDEAETEILAVAAGQRRRAQFQEWVERHVEPAESDGAS